MEIDRKYRHELKFEIPYGEYVAMRKRLGLVMKPDPHTGEDGRYRIRSIYFDNSDDKALREKIDGIAKREKFRIRYYNDDFSFITLEKKMKVNDLCLKYDAVITDFHRLVPRFRDVRPVGQHVKDPECCNPGSLLPDRRHRIGNTEIHKAEGVSFPPYKTWE